MGADADAYQEDGPHGDGEEVGDGVLHWVRVHGRGRDRGMQLHSHRQRGHKKKQRV